MITASTSTPTVLYISSVGRSGTTLMSKLLGQMPEFCDAGELWTFWGSAFTSGTCGCGRPVRACPFWLAVADSVFGGDFESERLRLAEIHTNAMGLRKTPAVWMHVRGLKRSHQYDVYARALDSQYRAVAEVSGAKVIVDCSHLTADAILASSIRGLNLYVLHVVRDPRAVAFSWAKEDDAGDHAHSPEKTALRWTIDDIYARALLRPLVSPRYKTLRYEDFVRDPKGTMELIVEWVGQSAAAVPHFSDSQEVELGATHSVFGNRVRFQSGTVPIRLDAEWRQKMSARDRAVGTALASPLLSCYGYPMRIGKGSPQTN